MKRLETLFLNSSKERQLRDYLHKKIKRFIMNKFDKVLP